MHDTQALIGSSPAMADLRKRVAVAARADAKVLITGESGTGKEVAASLLHGLSRRSAPAMRAINCAGLPETLLESALFGHARGSFTGADRDRAGLLESAHGGTALLDEVGEMSARMQGLLLRFLDSGEVQRVGDDHPRRRVDVRVVAATHRCLTDRVSASEFRLDLYYRLNVIHLHMPPLRERAEDVPELLAHFLALYSTEYGVPMPVLGPNAHRRLAEYEWPGNVRELRNVAERLTVDERPGVVDEPRIETLLESAPRRVPLEQRPSQTGQCRCRDRVDELFDRMVVSGESFWSAIAAPFMARDVTRDDIRLVIRRGLARTNGSYRGLLPLFNFGDTNERRLLSFLRRYRCDTHA